MLRLNEIDVRPAHRGEFRVLVAARCPGLRQLRAYLAADLLRRLAERTGLAPTVIDVRPEDEDDLRAVCADLNIHPPRYTLVLPVTPGQLAGQFPDGLREPVFDIGIRAAGEEADPVAQARASGPPGADGGASFLGQVAALSPHWIEIAGADGRQTPAGRALEPGEEPLSVRYRLMRHGYGGTPGNGREPGADAAELARWRELVAQWARSPSGAMSRPYADAIADAFADGLDTAAALRTLADLAADPAVPDGVKFETFAAADRLFGLDLARDVGR